MTPEQANRLIKTLSSTMATLVNDHKPDEALLIVLLLTGYISSRLSEEQVSGLLSLAVSLGQTPEFEMAMSATVTLESVKRLQSMEAPPLTTDRVGEA